MLCADTNVFVGFFRGTAGEYTDSLQKALDERRLLMNPFVLAELLSSPRLPKKTESYLLALPRLDIDAGFFERAGLLRRAIYQKGHGITLADIYIAQSCIDAALPLLTADQHFQTVAEHSDLKVISHSAE